MSDYRPASPDPVTLNAGVWQAAGHPNRTVTVQFDPRLLVWFVHQASRRSNLTYTVANGKPPAKVILT